MPNHEEYEFVECVSEETQMIDLFTHCKLKSHIKLSRYTLATRLSSWSFWILFDNMKNDKQICRLQDPFSRTASIQKKLLSLGVISFVSFNFYTPWEFVHGSRVLVQLNKTFTQTMSECFGYFTQLARKIVVLTM